MQIAKPKVKLGSLLLRLDLQYCLKGDEQVFQLSQSSYLKDLQYLNLRGCKITDTGFSELLQSKSMRSLAVLIVRDNKIKQIQGPFSDLEEATEKQLRKGVMNLHLLDIRGNKLTTLVHKDAVNFLKDTVVLMWGNPFENQDVYLH